MCAGTDALSPAPSCVGADRAAVGSAAPGVCPAPSCVGADRAAVGSAAPSCKAALAVGSPAPGVCPAPSCAQPAQAASRHSSSNIAMGLMKFPSSFSVVSYPLGQHFSLRTIIGIPPFPYDAARRAGPVGAAAPRARDVQTKQTMRPPGAGRTGDGARSRQTENRGWETGPVNKGTICPESVRPAPPPGARARPDRGYADNSL